MQFKAQMGKFLVCRRFWLDEPATILADDTDQFNYQEVVTNIYRPRKLIL